ncbi:MAG: hypothetical protein VR72_21530 [Clostridiaceae bacterium BRH_c20a]|nr:MAG: hypothetical protein VR72_21530 [Clostridiaceae bacterium BRH_c20a]
MKLVIAVVQDSNAPSLLENLVEHGFRATKLASTGGFLKRGNTTIFAGVENEKVPEIIKVIKEKCCITQQVLTPAISPGGPIEAYLPPLIDIPVSGANVFVIDVEQYIKV